MIKAIIFDLDGVIISTDKYHYQAWKTIADQEGIYFDETINNRLRGVSRMDSLEIVLEKANKTYTQEEKEALASKKQELYRSSLKKLSYRSLSKNTINAIRKLYEQGYHLAIGSSSKNTRFILERLNITNAFDFICDGTMISHSKPDPEVFIKAAEGLGYKPEECLVIEDATSGIDAAKAGGFIAIGIGDAATYDKTDYPIEKLTDIIPLIETINKKISKKLNIEHVFKRYPNAKDFAVKDFNLEIEEEEFVVFVGPSGCGKSTVLRMIAGLEEITQGEIYLDGKLLNNLDPKDRNIAMVFQNYALYPHLTVKKNIAFPLLNERIPFKYFFNFKWRKERKQRIYQIVEETAKKINLSEYLNRKPANLSGGQRQRVALGRAIVRNPKVFLLDEPLSNLDAKMRVQMRSEITRLHNDLKTVFIYVTHDQVEAMTMGTKIVVLKDGVIQQVATPEELFLNPVNMFVAGFIGTPQMNFIDATITKKKENYFVSFLGVKDLPLPMERMKNFNEENLNKVVVMGVRPRAISVGGDITYTKQGFKGTIKLFEQLGEETNVYAKVEGLEKDLIITTSGLGRFTNEEEIEISFDLKDVCFFDKDNEGSII
ncbi:MAG: beta-phosphoglucomutase [Bacilli bacterium]|nr:beta-phosphoglucomutase [Bacilli bacterium]